MNELFSQLCKVLFSGPARREGADVSTMEARSCDSHPDTMRARKHALFGRTRAPNMCPHFDNLIRNDKFIGRVNWRGRILRS